MVPPLAPPKTDEPVLPPEDLLPPLPALPLLPAPPLDAELPPLLFVESGLLLVPPEGVLLPVSVLPPLRAELALLPAPPPGDELFPPLLEALDEELSPGFRAQADARMAPKNTTEREGL
jgi:hypothetical protein